MRGMMRLALLDVPGAQGQSDTTAPTVEITSAAAATVYEAFSATITFSEAVTGFEVGDITAANATLSEFADSGDATVYTVTVTPTASGAVTLDIAAEVCEDAAGNKNEAATQFSRTYASGYLLVDNFSVAESAPIASPRTCDGIGTLTAVQSDGQFSISDGKLVFPVQATPAWNDQALYGEVAQAAGLMALLHVRFDLTGNKYWFGGLLASPPGEVALAALYTYDGTRFRIKNSTQNSDLNVGAYAATTDYQIAVIRLDTQCLVLIRGGGYASWTLLWITHRTVSGNVFAGFSNLNQSGVCDYIKVKQLDAPYTSDYGICTLNVGAPVSSTAYTGEANGFIEMALTAPDPLDGSADTRCGFYYRTDEDLTPAMHCYVDGAGAFRLDSIAADGERTNLINVADSVIAGETRTIRIDARGSEHRAYILGILPYTVFWYQMGSVVTASLNDTVARVVPVAPTGWTISDLRVYPGTLDIPSSPLVPFGTDELPIYRSDMTINPDNPIITTEDTGTGGVTLADPCLWVINDKLYCFFESTDATHVGQDWMAESVDGVTWGNFSRVSTGTEHYAHPVIYEENGTIHCFMQKGNGLIGYRSSPVEGFPSWTDEINVFDSDAFGWHHMREFTIFKHTDGNYYLLGITGDGTTQDQQIRGLWCNALTTNWNTNGTLISASPLLDMDDHAWGTSIVEIHRLYANGRFLIYLGVTSASGDIRAISAFEVSALTTTSFAGNWVEECHTFPLGESDKWDGQMIHCLNAAYFGGQWVVAYDARLSRNPDVWKIGFATR